MQKRRIRDSNPPANHHVFHGWGGTEDSTVRARLALFEQVRVVELPLLGEDMGVRAGGRHEVVVADLVADPSPRHRAQVQVDSRRPVALKPTGADGGPPRAREDTERSAPTRAQSKVVRPSRCEGEFAMGPILVVLLRHDEERAL